MMQIPMVSKGNTTLDLRQEKQYKWNDADPDGFQRKHYLRSAAGKNTNEMMQIPMVSKGNTTLDLHQEKTIQMKWCKSRWFPKETLP